MSAVTNHRQQDLLFGNGSSYILHHLEVYNWGPFGGLHRAEFHPEGTAIIGPTGSGKTTLVDALMTLLVARPKYNLASTGGHESDRKLIDYVRGVLGGDGADGCEDLARPGKTIAGICATYQGGEHPLRLAALLWTDGTGNAADDLKHRWIFSQAENQTFETWLRLLHEQGVRDLMRLGRETAGLRIFDSKSAYLAHARKFFSVGENAFTLLNRAAGLKQLNSIDEIFRELVLDDRSAFDRAIEVAGEFDNLAAIRAELETARKQQESLVPVAEEHQRLLRAKAKTERYRTLKRILPIWFAIAAAEKWSQEVQRLAETLKTLQSQLAADESQAESIRATVEILRETYLQIGGNVIQELEISINFQRSHVSDRRKQAQLYQQLIARFGLNDQLTEQALRDNQTQLTVQREKVQTERELIHGQTLAAHSQLREAEIKVQETEEAIAKVKSRPGSNIPPRFQDFRSDLSATLGRRETDLPFLAEMIEVKLDESAWRGAIERAIGSERLCVLVPQRHLPAALQWVNHRDNRLHIRLQAAHENEPTAKFFDDGYTRKLNFKNHPLIATAKVMLARRDLHCVSSSDELERTEQGLTIEGMMSGRQGRFEKQDQRRLGDDWMTGFDNKDQLESLAIQLLAACEAVTQHQTTVKKFQSDLTAAEERLQAIAAIIDLDFATIDLPSAESALRQSEQRLQALLDPNSDASKAKIEYERKNEQLREIEQAIQKNRSQIAVAENQRADAERERDDAQSRGERGLTNEEAILGNSEFKLTTTATVRDVNRQERESLADVEKRLGELMDRVTNSEHQLVRRMEIAKRVDTGALLDVGSDLQDIPHYLERLRVLNDEALPEKRARFLEYLNRSSDQGVTQLLASITEEVDAIEQRIRELNQTLVKVNFRSDRYLQLQPQRIADERLRALETAMRKVRSAALKEDGGESHYRALQEMIAILREAGEKRQLKGSKALLDPRFRLEFRVVEVDRQTGATSPPRTGSQSGSGGEKELMASHILTASLSYALCPTAATRPLYATVVLDEAFSKSSPSAASRIIEALKIFCLHPIFVTPNKEIGLLKQHTRRVICVQRPGKQATLASISWEVFNDLAERLAERTEAKL